jgi:carbon monoxide dehydrogenase subunit G
MILRWEGTLEIETAQDRVWAGLVDPAILARCAGSEGSAKEIGPHKWEVPAKITIGMFRLPVTLEIAMHDLEPPSEGKMTLTGTGPGAGIEGRSSIRITPIGPERTRLEWKAETTIGGALAKFGAGLIEPVVRAQTEGFWSEFARAVR